MHITISEENRIVLEELKNEAIQIKQEAKELSISILIQLKTLLFQFVLSYKEYSLTNIREYGLGEILMSRANRFFKLDQGEEKQKNPKEKKKTKFQFKTKKHKDESQIKTNNIVRSNVAFKTKSKTKTKSKRGVKYVLNKSLKLLLFPFYIIFLIFGMLLESNSDEKKNKNVKNTYKPY